MTPRRLGTAALYAAASGAAFRFGWITGGEAGLWAAVTVCCAFAAVVVGGLK